MKDQSKYDNKTKSELYQEAREKNIPDKSSMSKEELKQALEKSDTKGQSTSEQGKKKDSKAGKREQLLEFLDEKAFDPVLNASPGDYKDDERKKLEDARSTTRSTKERYHNNYKTAEDVKQNFESDQDSSAANKVDKELKDLGLPTLPGIHDEFMELCNKLGIH